MFPAPRPWGLSDARPAGTRIPATRDAPGAVPARSPALTGGRDGRSEPRVIDTQGTTPLYEAKAELFRVLGHPVRVRILELLRDGERSVGSLQGALGLDSSGTSQHLAALRKHGLVVSRRQGTSVYYTAADPAVFGLLAAGRDFLAASLGRQQALLQELAGSLVADGADGAGAPGDADA